MGNITLEELKGFSKKYFDEMKERGVSLVEICLIAEGIQLKALAEATLEVKKEVDKHGAP